MIPNAFRPNQDEIERLADAWVAVYRKDARWHARQKSNDLREWGDRPGAVRLRRVAGAIGRRALVAGLYRLAQVFVSASRPMPGSP